METSLGLCARRRRLLSLLLGTCLAASTGLAAEDVEYSEPARLAAQSLLLDAAVAGERTVAVGERGHILLSEGSAALWRQVRAPTRSTLTAVHFPTASGGWAVGHDAVILHTDDGGESWERQHHAPELESPLLDVWFGNDRRGYAIGAYGLFLSTSDGGATWERRMISDNDSHHNAIVQAPDGRFYIVGEFGSIFRSEDGGEIWVELDSPYEASFFGLLAPPDGALLVFGLRGRVYRSVDGGETWRRIETGTENSLMGGAVLDNGNVVLGGLVGTVLVGTDGTAFQSTQRSDRRAVSALVSLPDGTVAVFGAFGVDVFEPPELTPTQFPSKPPGN